MKKISILLLTGLCIIIGRAPAYGVDLEINASPSAYLQSCRKALISLQDLGLSSEQKVAVADVFLDHRAKIQGTQQTFLAYWRELAHAITNRAESFAEDQVRAAFAQLSNEMEERVVAQAQLHFALQQVLDARQYQLLLSSEAQLLMCARAPRRAFFKGLGKWVQQHTSLGITTIK